MAVLSSPIVIFMFISEIFWRGPPQIFWSFMSPYLPLFIAFLLTNFRKFSKFGVLCPAIFFEKFPKISRKFPEIFSTFSKSKKTAIFTPKIVHNHYINQNLAKFSLKTPKNSRFSLKILDFSKFSAPSAPKIWSFMSQKFGVLCPKGSPPGRGVPPQKNTLI